MKAAKPADRKRMLIHLTLGADEKDLVEGEEGEEGEEGDDGEEDNEGGVSRASESEGSSSRATGKTLDGVLKTARTTAKRASKRAMRIRACDTAVCTCSCEVNTCSVQATRLGKSFSILYSACRCTAERLSNVTDTYSEAEFVLLCGVAILFVRRGACGFVPPLHLARVGRVLDLVTKS